ncbi:hypothetical protein Aduo_000525 [Ancylostoma duodenale]
MKFIPNVTYNCTLEDFASGMTTFNNQDDFGRMAEHWSGVNHTFYRKSSEVFVNLITFIQEALGKWEEKLKKMGDKKQFGCSYDIDTRNGRKHVTACVFVTNSITLEEIELTEEEEIKRKDESQFGTIGAEIVEQVPDGDAIFLAIGGGGMASGVAAYVSEVRPDIKVFLVEPEADGIRVLKVGENCYPILKRTSADKIITVTDQEIREALKLLWTRTKQRVEPSAAVPLAGLLKVTPAELGLKEVVLILCGGNVDLDFVP